MFLPHSRSAWPADCENEMSLSQMNHVCIFNSSIQRVMSDLVCHDIYTKVAVFALSDLPLETQWLGGRNPRGDHRLSPVKQNHSVKKLDLSSFSKLTWLDRLLTISGGSESLSVVFGESGMPIPRLYLVNASSTSSVARSLINPANDCSTSLKFKQKLASTAWEVAIDCEPTRNRDSPCDASNNSKITKYNSFLKRKHSIRETKVLLD